MNAEPGLHQLSDADFNDLIHQLQKSKWKPLSHLDLLTHLTKGKEACEAQSPAKAVSWWESVENSLQMYIDYLERPEWPDERRKNLQKVIKEDCPNLAPDRVTRLTDIYAARDLARIPLQASQAMDEVTGALDRAKALLGEQAHRPVSSRASKLARTSRSQQETSTITTQTREPTLAERGVDQFGTSIAAAKESIAELLQTSAISIYTEVMSILTQLTNLATGGEGEFTEDAQGGLV
jgi:hypothetical protein